MNTDNTQSELDEADLPCLLETVERLAAAELGATVSRPEQVMAPQAIAQAIAATVDSGILNCSSEAALGLWDHPADPLQRRFSLYSLRCFARYLPAFAYRLHLQGLASMLDRRYELDPGNHIVCPDGAIGTGRQALGGWLRNTALDADACQLLQGCWGSPDADAPRLLQAQTDWTGVWLALWHDETGLIWHRVEREKLEIRAVDHCHGFDELQGQWLQLAPGAVLPPPDNLPEVAQQDYALIGEIHALALLAIACGAAERALKLATDYAASRRQGGTAIARHTAVQQLMEQARSALWLSQQTLDHLAVQSPGPASLVAAWRARAGLHPRLCHAASNAMQVFGGIGYMQDIGVEKALRDCNQLRLLAGTPGELALCCAGWEAESAQGTAHARPHPDGAAA